MKEACRKKPSGLLSTFPFPSPPPLPPPPTIRHKRILDSVPAFLTRTENATFLLNVV